MSNLEYSCRPENAKKISCHRHFNEDNKGWENSYVDSHVDQKKNLQTKGKQKQIETQAAGILVKKNQFPFYFKCLSV